jgi:cyclohexanecarboxylate-CoA ligase
MENTGESIKPWADIRPSADLARKYRQLGFWRDATPVADLRHWARETPDAVAITAHTAAAGTQRMTYREYAARVERVTVVLAELGIGPGDVVIAQLPNWWQLNAVVLACARLGAIAAPVITTIRARELELMLSRLAPVAYVTTEAWDGYKHAAMLASIADRLPAIKHRIIVGGHAAAGEIDLDERIEQVPASTLRITHKADDSAEDPDRVSIVLFTSGTTGAPKAVLHSFNTFYASYRFTGVRAGLSSLDVMFTPHAVGHVLGLHMVNMLPLYLGAQAFISDTWDPEASADLLAEHGVTFVIAAPVFIEAIARAARRQHLRLPRLRHVNATATTIPASLVAAVSDDLGRVLETGWGMTETGGASLTSADEDPPNWAARSIGSPYACMEVDLRSDGEVSPQSPGRLFVRGANVCLATMPRDGGEVTVLADGDGAWYDTGDLVVPDGRSGLRMVGRAADRIGGALMIPVADVEDALRGHPDIDDAALIGYGPQNQLPCAVIVSQRPPTLHEVRGYLDGIGMTVWYQPQRLEVVDRLPRNATGKVDKYGLRTWLATLDDA